MSPSPQIAPPGSSSYSSDTLYVGDGTWSTEKNSFLLPNLVGLNFATMRYNGMGNRFFAMAGYHSLIRAHGILAAITFLGLVPAAIMLARFYRRSPFWALRLHIWMQILVLILTTVLFILGFFAVGPERNLSNPHHGIGLAIYVMVLVQVLGGWLVHRNTKGKRALRTPLKLVLHHWFGRTIALLGLIQIPLGLTLYGSPKELFILYALAMVVLVLTYFILSFLQQRRHGHDYDGASSYFSGTEGDMDGRSERKKSGLGKLAVGGLGAAGLAALLRRRSSGKRPANDDMVGTESGTSYMTNEKYSDTSNKGLKNKFLTIGAVVGGIAAVKALFGKKEDDSSDLGPYRPPLGGNTSVTTESYLEEGRPHRPVTPTGASPGHARPSHPLAQPPMTPHHLRSQSSLSYSTYTSGSPSRRDRRHNFRDTVAKGGAMFALRQVFKSRRQRKEDRRSEEDRLHRVHQDPYTGEGFSPVPNRSPNRIPSRASTDFSSNISAPNRRRPSGRHAHNTSDPPLGGVGAASAAALANRDRIRPAGADPPVQAGPSTMPESDMPPPPPVHSSDVDSSGSDVYTTKSGHPHNRRHHHHNRTTSAGRSGSRRRHSGRTQNTDSVESPPVSLKVKMHNDGRHVTLRRLTEEEAANQRRENRRAKRATVPGGSAGSGVANTSSRRRRRNSSFSSSSGGEGAMSGGRRTGSVAAAERRWRRTEDLERQQAEQATAAQQQQYPEQQQYTQRYPYQQQDPQQQYPQQQQEQQQAFPQPPLPPPQAQSRPYNSIPPPPGAGGAGGGGGPDPSASSYFPPPPPPPIPQSSTTAGPGHGGAPSGIGSITSPGTETSGATEYANNRRRRRAERAQARMAREGRTGGGGGSGGVEFT